MDVRIGKNAIVTFRINEQIGTAEDETKQFRIFVNFLAKELIPYSTARLNYIKDTDNAIWGVMLSVNDYAIIAKAYNLFANERSGK